jgi:hypothetical protein
MKTLIFVATAWLTTGCTSVDPTAVDSAEVFFPPRFRYVGEPRFCFSSAERERARRESKEMGADTLFELVIDEAGKVRKARLVTTRQPEHRHEDMVAHAYRLVFTEVSVSGLYRAFFFPTRYAYESKFDWAHR